MRHKNSLALLTYWNTRRRNRAAPTRAEMEPADITGLLPHIFICEESDDDSLVFRLAGTAICHLFGRELKGAPIDSLWIAEARRSAARVTRSVTGGVPAVLAVDGLSAAGRVLQAELLLLPLGGTSGRIDRVFGSLNVIEPPYWIGHDPLAGLSTTAIRFLDMNRPTPFIANRPEIALPRTPSPTAQHHFGRRKVGHLTVLDGGREK